MSEPRKVPLTFGGQVVGEASVRETEDGVEVTSFVDAAGEPLQIPAGSSLSFALPAEVLSAGQVDFIGLPAGQVNFLIHPGGDDETRKAEREWDDSGIVDKGSAVWKKIHSSAP